MLSQGFPLFEKKSKMRSYLQVPLLLVLIARTLIALYRFVKK